MEMMLVGVCMGIVGRMTVRIDWGRRVAGRVCGGRMGFDSRFAGDTTVACFALATRALGVYRAR